MEIKSIIIIITGILVSLLAVILISSGAFLSPSYLEPWNKNYADKFDDPRIKVVSQAILAPNSHNMQPWKVKMDENDKSSFYLYVDSKRLTPAVDPYSRQIVISQGTFLEYMRISGLKMGYDVEINLFPMGELKNSKESMDNLPVAKITLKKAKEVNSHLYDSMFMPDTSRVDYTDKKLSNEQIDTIKGLNNESDVEILVLQDPDNVTALGEIAVEGAQVEANVQRISEESKKLLRTNEYQKNQYRYGFSLEGQGSTGIPMYFTEGLLTLLPSLNDEKSSKESFINGTQSAVEHTPTYILIITKNNNRTNQVKTGILYSRVLLNAQSMGLAMHPLSQSQEEYPEMKMVYEKLHQNYASGGSTIQMMVRIGEPTKKVPFSMRRDVMDLIVP